MTTVGWKVDQQSDRIKLSSLNPGTLSAVNIEFVSSNDFIADATTKLNINGQAETSTVTVVTDLTADTNSLVVKASSGLVGIGTTNPTAKLTVSGDITSSGTLFANTLTGAVATGSQPNVTSIGTLGTLTVSGNTTIDTNTLTYRSSTGFVGIGTTNPAYQLDVVGSINYTGNLYKNGSLYSLPADNFWDLTGSNMTTDAYVGIGSTNPTAYLDVVGTTKIAGDVRINGSYIKRSITEINTATVDTTKEINLLDSTSVTTFELLSITNSADNQGRRITLVNKTRTNASVNVNVRQTVGGTIIANVVIGNSKSFVFFNNTWYQE